MQIIMYHARLALLRMTLDCSRIAEVIAMASGFFVQGRRQTLLSSLASDKNEKDHIKNLRSKLN